MRGVYGLEVTGTHLLLRWAGDADPVAEADWGGTSRQRLIEGVDQVIGSVPPGGKVRVILRPPVCQIRTLHRVPALQDRDLIGLLREGRERFFRQPPAEGAFGVEVAASRTGGGVRAAVVDQAIVGGIETAMERAGARVTEFDAVGCDEPAEAAIPIRTAGWARRRRSRSTARWVAFVLCSLGPWLVLGGIYVGDLYRDWTTITSRLLELEDPLRRVAQIESEISRHVPLLIAVNRQGPQGAWATRALIQLHASLPRDAHLHRLVADTARIEAQVHTSKALDVIEGLTGSWPGVVEADRRVLMALEEPGEAEFQMSLEVTR